MEQVYLISEDTLKTETIINDNTDPMYISPAIFTAQNIGLREIIGTKLLEKLCDLVAQNEISNPENEKYKNLLDKYVQPYLKFKVCSEITLPLAYKYRNSGVVQTNNEQVINSTMEDAQTMKKYYDDKANFFATLIKIYLKENGLQCTNCRDSKDKVGYNTSIFLG